MSWLILCGTCGGIAKCSSHQAQTKIDEDSVCGNVLIDMLMDAIQRSITFPAWHGRNMSSFWKIGEALTSFHEPKLRE